MNDVFLTSDQHHFHDNIIKYCNRPFSSSEEMTETLIEEHNKVVKPGDRCYMLGDAVFHRKRNGEYSHLFNRLNGELFLIRGNHDYVSEWSYESRKRFVWIKDLEHVQFRLEGGTKILVAMCHYPLRTWLRKEHGSYMAYGHCHNTLDIQGEKSMDVGVDSAKRLLGAYRPFSLEEFVEICDSKKRSKS